MCKTADSLADHADSRRQKTGWTNGSAKADADNLADKDRYHISGDAAVHVVCCFSATSALSARDIAVHVDVINQ